MGKVDPILAKRFLIFWVAYLLERREHSFPVAGEPAMDLYGIGGTQHCKFNGDVQIPN